MAKHRIAAFIRADQPDLFTPCLAEWGLEDEIEVRVVRSDAPAEPEDVEGCEGLIMGWKDVDYARLPEMKDLRIACRQSIGIDGIDVDAFTRAGIGVSNTPNWCSYDVGLHSVALMLDLYKKLTYLDRHYRLGEKATRGLYEPNRPCGQTFGMVFFGHIAQCVLPMVKALDMNVLVYAPTKSAEYLRSFGCEKAATVEELCRRSDVVSLYCPLLPETRHIIGAPELTAMKPTAFLINVARGGLVDDEALATALREGQIRGAGLDCLEHEHEQGFDPLASPLLSMENVVATPHAAWYSVEARAEQPRIALRQLVDYLLDGKAPSGLANPEVLGFPPHTPQTTK